MKCAYCRNELVTLPTEDTYCSLRCWDAGGVVRAEERARIVAWLRSDERDDSDGYLAGLADRIEGGEHNE